MTEKDPFDDPRWQDFASAANARLIPMIRGSSLSLAQIGDGDLDIQQALEIGAILLLDKPLILMVEPGSKVPAGLAKAAVAIIERNPDDDKDTQARLSAAMEALEGDD